MPALDPTLEGAARSTLGRMQHDLQTLHGKMIQAAKRRDETLRRQFMRTRALAFPGGHAQERTIGFVSFLNQYGPALVDRLIEELPLDLGQPLDCHHLEAAERAAARTSGGCASESASPRSWRQRWVRIAARSLAVPVVVAAASPPATTTSASRA